MPTVTASIGITPELWEKCRQYNVNKSAIARAAIAKEIERLEKETGAEPRKPTPAVTPSGGT